MTEWEYVKEFYKQHFGIEGWVVELYANMDILTLCASGASNKTITEVCDIELDDLVEVLMNTFKFPGWAVDLPCNPYKIYLESLDNFPKEAVLCFVGFKEIDVETVITQAYRVCKTMKEIEERIADEWI